ncbi:MAG: amidohydrolase family protein [Verrucomicrobia bacterium]|nr:amidohydrolase family protein [Verrucomicrobiota bacterium]
MNKIDAHHHFWNYDLVEYPWIDDSLAALRRDFGCGDLIEAVEGCDVVGAVSVQARTTLAETEALLDQGSKCDLVKGVVGWAPLKDPGVGEILDGWKSHPLFKGVREICQGAPDSDFFDNDDFDRGIRFLSRRSLPFDLLLYEAQLGAVLRFVDRHPHQKFIVDHIAKPEICAGAFAEDWARDLKELGSRDNVVGCKFSGVVTEVRDPEWNVAMLVPYFDAALEAFGARRLMFGSDWPVCLSRAAYRSWVDAVDALTVGLTVSERANFYVANATRVYDLT